MKRTPMKRQSWSAPAASMSREQRLETRAQAAIKNAASMRKTAVPGPVGSVLANPITKAHPVRNEAYRRAVASLPCAICGVPGYSQAAHGSEGKGMAMKRTPFKRKNNAENIQSKVAQRHAQQARVAIISIVKSAKKRAFNAVGCSESPKQSTCMRGLHA